MMSQKMFFVLGLWLLCVFLANLPAAWSIECYACADYPGSTEPCNSGATLQCDSYFDSCMSMTTTVEIFGMNYTTTAKNCSMFQFSCNQTYICDQVNSSVAAAGGSVTQCNLHCCHGDLCNGQGGGTPAPPTAGPDAQSELKYYIGTIRGLLDQMEYIVENGLGGHLSVRKRKGRAKKRAALSLRREKKRGAKSLKRLGEAMENIQESLAKLVPNKR